MSDLKYSFITWWSTEDNCYLAKVPKLPGCMADGETISELTDNLQVVMYEWLSVAEKTGMEIPEPDIDLNF